ncbi:MAG: citrate lyase beta subunit, partial [Elusimicrobia bacterium]|nr:citrate lyase beta subunit [Elusimicrobiota bacterium]
MNDLELKMMDILKELKDKYGAVSVRAEFEAEGTKLEELLRLKEISMKAGVGLVLKIGGCESVRDMLEARVVGVDSLVAPMVETAYSLRKYLEAVKKVFPAEELKDIEIITNIETKTACNNLEAMMAIPEIDILQGIDIERVDLSFSLGKDEKSINDDDVNDYVSRSIKTAKKQKLLCSIGGGVSAHSIPFFRSLPTGTLDRYETRKVCFNTAQALKQDPEKGIL